MQLDIYSKLSQRAAICTIREKLPGLAKIESYAIGYSFMTAFITSFSAKSLSIDPFYHS